MNQTLVRRLPTPLAVAYASHHYGQQKRVETLFWLLENTLLFVENILRAQAMDYTNLARPISMGFRVNTIKRLGNADASRPRSFVATMLTEDARIDRIVRARNRWAHVASADRRAAEINIAEIEHDMDCILEPLTELRLFLKRQSDDFAECFLLAGLRGLFEPERVRDAPWFPTQFNLAVAENEAVVVLWPFMKWKAGPIGENRVQLLTSLRGELGSYSDPLGETENVRAPLGDGVIH